MASALLRHLQVVGGLGLLAPLELFGLGDHVFDLRQFQRAVLLAFVQGAAGNVGMDMDLEDLVVVADDQGVADALQVAAQGLQIRLASRSAPPLAALPAAAEARRETVRMVPSAGFMTAL